MTENKQIIIDDIDVSGCEHLYREIDCLAHIDFSECCEVYNPSYGYCPNIPNCYYKQLKRKEQECQQLINKNNRLEEELNAIKLLLEGKNNQYMALRKANDEKNEFLKKLGISATGEFHRIKYYIDKLYQECEELKKQVNDLLNKPEIQDKILWKIDNEAFLGSKDAWIYKLEQTLPEIKEIAKRNHKTKEELFEIRHSKLTKFSMGALNGRHNLASEILQKISEVEEQC